MTNSPNRVRADAQFNRLLAARLIDVAGTAAILVPTLLLATSLFGSSAGAGVLASATAAASLVVVVWGGVIGDRFPRRTVMVGAMCVLVLCSTITAVIAHATPGRDHTVFAALIGVSIVEGAATAAFLPAFRAGWRSVTAPEDIPRRLSTIQSAAGLLNLAGPVAGGVLYQLDRALPFVVDAISYLLAIGILATAGRLPHSLTDETTSVFDDLRGGWRFVRAHRTLLELYLLGPIFAVGSSGITYVLLLEVARQQRSPLAIGLIQTAAVAGMTIGAVIAPLLIARIPIGRLGGISALLVVPCVVALALSIDAPYLAYVVIPVTIIVPLIIITYATFETRSIPDAYQARVNSVGTAIEESFEPVIPLIAAALITVASGKTSLLIFAAVLGLAAIAINASGRLRTLPLASSVGPLPIPSDAASGTQTCSPRTPAD